jgi:hypothetical protein
MNFKITASFFRVRIHFVFYGECKTSRKAQGNAANSTAGTIKASCLQKNGERRRPAFPSLRVRPFQDFRGFACNFMRSLLIFWGWFFNIIGYISVSTAQKITYGTVNGKSPFF